jgi:hypothetical protein
VPMRNGWRISLLVRMDTKGFDLRPSILRSAAVISSPVLLALGTLAFAATARTAGSPVTLLGPPSRPRPVLCAQAVQHDAQAGFCCPAGPGILGQGADDRQQERRGQVRAERDVLTGALEQAGEAVFHRAAQGADGLAAEAKRLDALGYPAYATVGTAPLLNRGPAGTLIELCDLNSDRPSLRDLFPPESEFAGAPVLGSAL